MRLTDYLDLVDLTGRQIRENKRGSTSKTEPAIMDRLGTDAEHWLYITQNFESEFKGIVDAAHEVKSKISQFWDGNESEGEPPVSLPANYAFPNRNLPTEIPDQSNLRFPLA